MKYIALIVALMLSCSIAFADQPSRVNVMDYGAKADGVTDDTAAFAKALTAVNQNGGTVFAPTGNYMIKSHLVIPSNVTLEGVWTIPTAFSQMKGTTLLAVEGAGTETGPAFITLNINSCLKGITVYYPEQKVDTIVPYPWCIQGAGGDNMSIVDCLIVNPYKGVDFASNPSGRHYIRNLYGQPLKVGISVDKCYDVGRIENVHFWPFWKLEVLGWMAKNSEAFVFARTDWEYVLNTFCFGYGVGMRFTTSKDGAMNGNLVGCGVDAAVNSVVIEQCQSAGLLFTNGEFVAFGEERPCEVVVKDTNTGVVQFNNCAYWGMSDNIARIAGSGTVSFTGCNLLGWDTKQNKTPAIELTGGNLIVSSCNFNGASPQLSITGKAKSAIVMGNRMGGPKAISNTAKADLQLGLNVFEKAPQRPKEEAGAIVVDDTDGAPSVEFIGKWERAAGSDSGYFIGTRWAWKGNGEAKAIFTPKVPKTGRYRVYAYFGPDPMKDHAQYAPVRVHHLGGTATVHVDMRRDKGRWVLLGTYVFQAGSKGSIVITNDADGNVMADAVKLVRVK